MKKNLIFSLFILAIPFLHADAPFTLSELDAQATGEILACKKGTLLTFQLSCEGGVVALCDPKPCQVELLQDLYVRCDAPNEPLFSLDGEGWKSFQELFTGQISGYAQAEDGELVCGLKCKVDLCP